MGKHGIADVLQFPASADGQTELLKIIISWNLLIHLSKHSICF